MCVSSCFPAHGPAFLGIQQRCAPPSASPSRPHASTGNSGVRYFPYTGYLGLTPIKVEGGTCFPRVANAPSHSPQPSSPSWTRTANPSLPNASPSPSAAMKHASVAQAYHARTPWPSTHKFSGPSPKTNSTPTLPTSNSHSAYPYPPRSAATVHVLSWSTGAFGG